MRRADRLFDILLALRGATRPVTAASLAERLEVTPRTIYRDVAALQGRRVPIEGEAGVGYILRRGFELPPLMFTVDEVEAIAVGVRMLGRLHDAGLADAADSVMAKVNAVLPEALRTSGDRAAFYVSKGDAVEPRGVSPSDMRRAIRERWKIRITYSDAEGRRTHRTIWPMALAYLVDVTLLGAWCELRGDLRHFRIERIVTSSLLTEPYPRDDGRLLRRLLDLQRQMVEPA